MNCTYLNSSFIGLKKWVAVFFAFALWTQVSHAIVLDWSNYTPSWSYNSSTHTYTTSINFDSTNPGNDVTITISGDTDFLTSSPYNSPGVNSVITGGEGSSADALLLALNWSSRNDTITVKFDFNYADGIQNFEFAIFDIDRLDNNDADSGFRDYISNIKGSLDGGSAIIPSITVEDTDYTTVQNSGKSTQGIRGEDGSADNSDNANAYISFGTNVIDSVSFTYGNWTGSGGKAPNDPGQQGIAIYDFSFDKKTKVPEVGTSIAASLLCGFVVLGTYLRRRSQMAKAA